MPIRFRCSYCNRLLGIATRKAGMQTTCPHCGNSIAVPAPAQNEAKTERINVDDLDELLGKSAGVTVKEFPAAAPASAAPSPQAQTQEILEPEFEEPLSLPPSPPPRPPGKKKSARPAPAPEPADASVAKAPAASPPAPKARPKPPRPYDPDDPPLFEGDVEDILGETSAPEAEEQEKAPPATGVDATSLGESASRLITLSSQTATLLMVAVVVLMALSFAAGYLIAPRG